MNTMNTVEFRDSEEYHSIAMGYSHIGYSASDTRGALDSYEDAIESAPDFTGWTPRRYNFIIRIWNWIKS